MFKNEYQNKKGYKNNYNLDKGRPERNMSYKVNLVRRKRPNTFRDHRGAKGSNGKGF
jgi:hypothetical protein